MGIAPRCTAAERSLSRSRSVCRGLSCEAIGDQHGYRHTPDERRRHDQLLTDCTQRVGAPVVEAALRRGATLGIAEIAELTSVSNPPTIASATG